LAVANYVYTPDLNFSGDDSFAFVANDGKMDSNPTTIHLHVSHAVSINNVSVLEGNQAGNPATFTVTLSAPSTQIVTVNWATQDGTATAPSDYKAASGTLTFSPGITNQTISVSLVGDFSVETDEFFRVI